MVDSLDKYFDNTGLIKDDEGISIHLEAALIAKDLMKIDRGGSLEKQQVRDLLKLLSKLMVAYCHYDVLVNLIGKDFTEKLMAEHMGHKMTVPDDWDPKEHIESLITAMAWKK